MIKENLEFVLKSLTSLSTGNWWDTYDKYEFTCSQVISLVDKNPRLHLIVDQFYPDFNY